MMNRIACLLCVAALALALAMPGMEACAQSQSATSGDDTSLTRARSWMRSGDALSGAGKYGEAILSYQQAIPLFRRVHDVDGVGSMLGKIATCHNEIIRLNISWTPDIESRVSDKMFFRIYALVASFRDSVVVLVDGGSLDGISVGGKGEVQGVHSKDDPTRNETIFARAEVLQVHEHTATLALTRRDSTASPSGVRVGDLVILPVKIPSRDQRGILFNLSSLQIGFCSLHGDSLYHFRQVLYDDDAVFEDDVVEVMADDVRRTVKSLEPYVKDNPSWSDTLRRGLFAGMSLLDAMEQTTPADVRSFLRFVKSFPGKYMGHRWKFNETFATWIINFTPPGEESFRDPVPLLRLDGSPYLANFVNEKENRDNLLGKGTFSDWNDVVQSKADSGLFDQAYRLNDLSLHVAGLLRNDSSLSESFVGRGQIAEKEKKIDTAIVYYTRAIKLNSHSANAYWFRGVLYGRREDFDKAIADLDRVIALAPSFAAGLGSKGWYMILQGRFKEAREVCRQAYLLDSNSVSWAVNLGHTYLLEGDTAGARPYYTRTLSLLTSESRLVEGPLADFDIFVKKGWQVAFSRQTSAWMRSEFDAVYRFDMESLHFWTEGKKLLEQKKYPEAAAAFELSVAAEEKSRTPKDEWIMVEAEYAGMAFGKANQPGRGVKSYEQALAYARRRGATKSMISYLRSIAGFSTTIGDIAKAREYEQTAVSLERESDASGSRNDLYVLAIGIDDTTRQLRRYASADARAMADTLVRRSHGIFNATTSRLLVNAQATKDSIESALSAVAYTSKPGDTFLFYFAGQSHTSTTDFYLVPRARRPVARDSVTAVTAISARQLRTWFSKIQAQKQCIILDAPATSFIAEFVARSAVDEALLIASERDIAILCPKNIPTESQEYRHGMFTGVVLQGLTGKANVGSPVDSMITAKELDAFIAKYFSSDAGNGEVQSYSRGKDFAIGFAPRIVAKGADHLPPRIRIIEPSMTRGVSLATADKDVTVRGRVDDESGIYQVLVNDLEAKVLPDGSFSADVKLGFGDNMIRVLAADTRENVAIDTFHVARESADELPQEKVGRQGKDYALLIATNEYVEWKHLVNPIFDASVIAQTLKNIYGFDTTIVTNPTYREILTALRKFMAVRYTPEDQLFIFFAGHGLHDALDNSGYLVGRDSKLEDEEKVGYLSYDQLRETVNRIPCEHIFVVLDACFGGYFDRRDARRTRGDADEGGIYAARPKEEIIKEKMKLKTRLFMTSGGKTYVPDGEPGHHSPFASKFLKALEEGGQKDGYLTFHRILPYVEDAKSVPRYGDFGDPEPGSDFFFEVQVSAVAKGKTFKRDTLRKGF